jgi:hypothetical protein
MHMQMIEKFSAKRRMRLLSLIALSLLFLRAAGAESPILQEKFTVALQGAGYTIPFVYRNDRPNSPVQIFNIDSKFFAVSSLGFAVAFDPSGSSVPRVITYPKEFLLNEGYFVVANGNVITASANPEVSAFNLKSFEISHHVAFPDQPVASRYPFYLRDTAFFYEKKGGLVAIGPDNALLGEPEVTKLLLAWLSETRYPDQETKLKHAKLLRTGKFLIVDGLFYTSDRTLTQKYFDSMGIETQLSNRFSSSRNDYFLSKSSDSICGVALNGDTYFQATDGIMVIDQSGINVANISMANVDQLALGQSSSRDDEGDKFSPTFYTVLPNGTLYAMKALANGTAHFFSVSKSWGTDYVEVARLGVTAASRSDVSQQLQTLSNSELRIVRNAMFALHGYDFKSWDLKSYFNGYQWYHPSPNVKADSGILNVEQKGLLYLLVAEEARRK